MDILIGQQFGRLIVKSTSTFKKKKVTKYFWCECICGLNFKCKLVNKYDLLNGNVKSCGCLDKENRIARGREVSFKNIKYKTENERIEVRRQQDRERYAKNPEKFRKASILKSKRYKDKIKKRLNKKYYEDPLFRTKNLIMSRIRKKLNGVKARKNKKTDKYLGCSISDYIIYLESKFQPGMTWDNQGKFGWHIDHIRPLASFDLTDENEQLKAFHYSNTQPMWATENMTKGAKYVR